MLFVIVYRNREGRENSSMVIQKPSGNKWNNNNEYNLISSIITMKSGVIGTTRDAVVGRGTERAKYIIKNYRMQRVYLLVKLKHRKNVNRKTLSALSMITLIR